MTEPVPEQSPDPTTLDPTLAELNQVEFVNIFASPTFGVEIETNVDEDRLLALMTRAQFIVLHTNWGEPDDDDDFEDDEDDDDDDGSEIGGP